MMGDVVAGRGGTVVAVFQMAGDLGLVLGPVVTGLVADAAGYSPAFVVCAVVCVLPVFAVLAAPETLLPERSAHGRLRRRRGSRRDLTRLRPTR